MSYRRDNTDSNNRLPAALVQEKNLSVFKSMLRTFDFSYTLLGKL